VALGGVVETQFRLRTPSGDEEEALQRQVDDDVRVIVFFVLSISFFLACLRMISTISILFLGLMNCRRNDVVME
jgi:hypothetical protein